MLLHLLYPLHIHYSALNIFQYITFRTFGASITAVLFCLLVGPVYIKWLKKKQIGQVIREEGPKSHYSKKGTPTMGGGLILLSVTVSTLLWADIFNKHVWIALGAMILFGVIGFFDDYLKITSKAKKGLSVKQKLVLQFIFGLVVSYLIFIFRETPPVLKFPFLKDLSIDLGYFLIPFSMLVIIGASNAVNLTDGLDGLAVGPIITTASTFILLAYCAGHIKIAEYLQISYVTGAGELAIFMATVSSACLGFLWFNTYPAQVFMGDIGSLALGAALGTVSILTKNEILLALCGGIFVLEAFSVMAQVISFKMTGKRVFKMAPIHHHFELKGWAEPKVIVRFWIISIVLALITLSSLKIR